MIRNEATQRQVDAANPRVSTWLSANAGSGKTRVLTDRVARLLLEGVSPQNILCLTYTKAAATEMQNRLFQRLGDWAMMADADLRKALDDMGVERQIDANQLRNARTLFARAIETPGGLKIQTIHSFCAGVLRRFPLEAQVSPQFREMEDRAAELLRAEVVDQLLEGEGAAVVHRLLAEFTGDDLSKLTQEIAGKRDLFEGGFDRESLLAVFRLSPDARADDALAMAFPTFAEDLADQIVDAFKGQSKSYVTFAAKVAGLNFADPDWDDFDTLCSAFLYAKDGTSKSVNFPQSNHTKAVEALASIADEVHAWMDAVAEARQTLLSYRAYKRSLALHDFAQHFIPAYEARKLAMGALDFDDLIRKTKSLLTDRDLAQWVLFRLDGGIDHILVDEAQDTSPTQWAVIEQLTQEFATGQGAREDRERTIFVVGDKKQSIYSFQGADPDAFDEMKAHFKAGQEAVGKTLFGTTLAHSFRSAQAILSVVDACFTGDRAAGMDDDISHIAFKDQMPGRVDLWPVIEKNDAPDDKEWFKPVDEPSPTDHVVQMADRIASQITWMINNEKIPEEVDNTGTFKRRPITEGDFLILVQRRSDLFAEIIRACKAADLKIAGADRLKVGAELAVKDLAALLNFVALPEDDLSLAAALRSPIFGWSEQDLFTLAHHRPEKTFLWAALRDNPAHPKTCAVLNDLRAQADFLRPYDLLERILIRHDGRQKLLARLGPEAEDGIDALLAQALAYESTSVPSLTGFLSWMQTDDVEIKRQMESKGDRIRVMTVHGAKGLEAPIVILPDAAKRDIRLQQELLPADGQAIWKPLSDDMPEAVRDFQTDVIEKQRRERLRLLYVAMTRAEKWLIVGAAGEVGTDDQSWYNIVRDGMEKRGTAIVDSGGIAVTRVAELDWTNLQEDTPDPIEVPLVTVPEFGAVTEPESNKTLAPSDLGGAKVLPGDIGDGDTDAAKARGTLIHHLLEHLPLAPSEHREALGLQIAPGEAALVQSVIRLLDHPDLAPIWSADALTEVDITAEIHGLGRIHGAIDRLIIADDCIIAIDYKSNQRVPAKPEQTPDGLLRQMAVYHAALTQIYPDTAINVSILWTETGVLMPLPVAVLHEAMSAIATP